MDQAREQHPEGGLERRYALIARVAVGGMATLHYARRLADRRAVAIKIMHRHLGADAHLRKTFLYEAHLAKRLDHPNMVQVYETGEDPERGVYMVMEYVEGGSLGDVMKTLARSKERLPPPIVARLVLDLCYALHAAHSLMGEDGAPLHLVHRDVSPQNVLVGLDGRARLVDFGIAKSDDRYTRTRQGQIKGKLAYLSPERLAKTGPIDRRVDVFAAGIVLWETLLTRRLFKAENEMQVVDLVLNPDVPPPSTIDLALAPYDAVVARALAKAPSARYATASDLADAILGAAEALGTGVADRETCAAAMAELLADEVARRKAKIGDGKTLTRMQAPPARMPPEEDTILEGDAFHGDDDDARDAHYDDLDVDTLDGQRPPDEETAPEADALEEEEVVALEGGPLQDDERSGSGARPPVRTLTDAPTRTLPRPKRPSPTLPLLVLGAAACLAVGGIVGAAIALSGDDEPPQDPETSARPGEDPSSFEQRLAGCQRAIMEVDPISALDMARAAVALRPGDPTALACQASANNLYHQQEIFDRGQTHYDNGETHLAFNEFDRLPASSPYREGQPGRVVMRAIRGYAAERLNDASEALQMNNDRDEAITIANFVLEIDGISPDQRRHANDILAAAARSAGDPEAASEPEPSGAAPTADPSLMEQARECMTRGDNQCAIRVLEGRARTQTTLGILIEAYRAQGRNSQAMRHMRTYVARWPETPQGRAYQQILARQR